jgi:ribosomal protein S18 acetylase RimI-like enzyme
MCAATSGMNKTLPNRNIEVRAIDSASGFLADVINLHRADSHRLGFFPKGAFEDHARVGQILLALDPDSEVLGYLLYRVAKQRATIVHLCTAPSARGKGVARALVEHLKGVTKPLAGIGLRCRQDYDARHLWAKFGFIALLRKVGRSQDGHELTFWWFDHGHPDLFSLASSIDERRQKVVVDANVFFDLQGPEQRDSEDSKALLADWVQASIELCVTKELFNEIDRASDPELRARSHAALTGYPVVKSDDLRFQRTCDELKSSFPEDAILRDESDLRQIAYTVAGEVAYFITRDEVLVERCEPLYKIYGLRALHPAELISELDVIERETQYRPARIEGSRLRNLAIKGDDIEMVIEAFRNTTEERVNVFRKLLLHFLSKPRDIETRLVTDLDNRPVIFGVYDRTNAAVLEITMLRGAEHGLAATMVRNFLRATLEAATRDKRSLIKLSDQAAGAMVMEALAEFGFAEVDGGWAKIAVRAMGDFGGLREAVRQGTAGEAGKSLAEAAQKAVEAAALSNNADAAAAVESRFWPAKVLGAGLPTFMVSIRSEWAQHFFDNDLAGQLLFGSRNDLLLGVEGVYYCSPKHRHVTAPARILWYVSRGSEGDGSMSIKACSRLEEVVIGKPKELFKRFRRLGVFEWKDVFKAAKNDITNDILALRFSMTERFPQPFSLDRLEAMDIRQPFLAPRRVSDEQFTTIYSYGCALA